MFVNSGNYEVFDKNGDHIVCVAWNNVAIRLEQELEKLRKDQNTQEPVFWMFYVFARFDEESTYGGFNTLYVFS